MFSVRDLLKYPEDYVFDFDVYLPTIGMNLQRPHVWTLRQRQELILSILKELKIPNVTLIQVSEKDRSRTYQVIDGKQRLSAIIDFANDRFPINVDGVDYLFSELSTPCQREILGFWITGDLGYEYHDAPISDAEKIRWFELINFAGTPQDAEHMAGLKKSINS